MKKLFLCAALVASLPGKTFAQEKPLQQTPTQKNFSLHPTSVRHRHIVYLQNQEKIVFELFKTSAYGNLKNLDSLVSIFMNDIAFYKDSLDAAGHVRINYVFTPDPKIRRIRFKKYSPDGDLFIRNHNDLSRLKVDRDTVTFLLEDFYNWNNAKQSKQIRETASVTFYVNNYTDVANITKDTELIRHIVDTLAATSVPKKNQWRDYTTIVYRPYSKLDYFHFEKVNAVSDGDDEIRGIPHKSQMLVMNASVGVGLVRNTFTPMADLYVELQDRWKWKHKNQDRYYSFVRLSASPYFFFEKDALGHHIVNDNWFVNVELGSQFDNETFGVKSRRASIGAGYLFGPRGGYFDNTTFKLFTNVELVKGIMISPELITTNNFKQFFPGITIKGFFFN